MNLVRKLASLSLLDSKDDGIKSGEDVDRFLSRPNLGVNLPRLRMPSMKIGLPTLQAGALSRVLRRSR